MENLPPNRYPQINGMATPNIFFLPKKIGILLLEAISFTIGDFFRSFNLTTSESLSGVWQSSIMFVLGNY
jgi:hypothetical protein